MSNFLVEAIRRLLDDKYYYIPSALLTFIEAKQKKPSLNIIYGNPPFKTLPSLSDSIGQSIKNNNLDAPVKPEHDE